MPTDPDLESARARAVARAARDDATVAELVEAAYACDRVGAEDDAIVWYDRAHARGVPAAERADFCVGYGSTLRNVGRVDEAVRVLRAAVADEPGSAALHAFLALALHSAGDPDGALASALDAVLIGDVGGYDRALRGYRDALRGR